MSLKAKLEAVIYAAEEPVTLAQLTFLFAEEALTWKAERETLQLEHARSAESAAETLELADSTVELAELLVVVEDGAEPEIGESVSDEPSVSEVPAAGARAESVPDPVESPTESANEPAIEPAIDPEAEAKRIQRQRERDVREILRGLLDELIAEYASGSRGIEIREIAGGFRMGTKPEIHDAVRSFVKSLKPPMKLSLPALETLAVIAYKQPVTAPEVGEIRGVDSAGVLGSLMSRKLIATAGRKQVIGRPMLYKTTKEFLLRFGLKDLNELPSMEEFEKMAALELSEGEDDSSEEAAQSGDLFAESETATVPAAGGAEESVDAPEAPVETGPAQAETAVPIPTAEPSQEAAEAQAPVERQDEIEVEP